ncbi:MAG: asparagine synthase B [Bacilli bacterium]|nr:asparagine synthase B [Bacilli bacterium]
MCGFMVSTNKKTDLEEFKRSLAKIRYRGPDQEKVIVKEGILGFNRLSIMGLTETGMQPFTKGENALVCNGEVYNFRKIKEAFLKEGYTFTSESDCEVLLPMYEKWGTEMFEKLDAEFSLALYDGVKKEFIAARDPIGIRPLFYGYDEEGKILFASEAKCLLDFCKKVMPFPPGHYYQDGKFVCYHDISKVETFHDDSLEEIYENIHQKLEAGVIKRLDADVPVGFMLSGGLDSSLVCSIASNYLEKPIRTFAIGMDKDAIDLKYAKEVADHIGSIHTEVIMNKKDVLEALKNVIYHLETYDITTIRASIGMYILADWIRKNTDIRVVLTGEVSDELFGYKYTDFAPSKEAFQEESEKRIRELYMYDVLRADRCISGCSLEARVPFADLDFVKYVMEIDPSKKMNVYGQGKYLLRKAFVGKYLPESILMREKAAFSDAVGHSMVDDLKEFAETYYTDADYAKKVLLYKEHTPFTKESLLYREIFESFYKDQSDMVIDFWMPNKNWEGCDVKDPSARVLKNYGNSGK